MSGIAAVVSGTSQVDGESGVRAMLAAMAGLGRDITEVHAAGAIGFGTTRYEWERGLHPSSTAALAIRGDRVVIADATLFHLADLGRAIGSGHTPAGDGAAEWILAAYEALGADGIARLEGDFAFVLWDGTRRRVLAARDFAGRRTLFHTQVGDTILLASTVGGLLADPRVSRTIDLTAVATVAAGLWAHSPRTAYEAITELPAGHLLEWSPGGGAPRVSPFWHPPETILHTRQPLDAATEELRALLVDAVRVRLAPAGPTGLSLSGGWDSTAVLGAGTLALEGARDQRLMPFSISYPEGDPGREDEMIREVEAHTGIATTWLAVDDIPLFGDAAGEAARRDVPFAHAYEHWNRTLSRTASEAGARVMLDGSGGDQLFQVSDIFLSDLFGRGRWIELARQWRGRGGHGIRNFWRWAVHPAIPVPLERLLARARKMPPRRHHFERQPPIWFVPRFLSAHGVLEREVAAAPKLPRSSRVLGETHAYLRIPYFPRIANTLHAFALEEGVELRSPLLDARVVQFATRRPWSERADRAETKILLRRAMTGLLPASVLAPRKRRTGITSAYFLRQMRGPGRPLTESLLQDPLLASIGMIDVPRLRRAWEHMLQHDNDEVAARIFFTLQAELWLRAHAGPSGSATSAAAVRS